MLEKVIRNEEVNTNGTFLTERDMYGKSRKCIYIGLSVRAIEEVVERIEKAAVTQHW